MFFLHEKTLLLTENKPSAKLPLREAGGTLHASVFEQNKYAETTTLFIIYSTLSNFKT